MSAQDRERGIVRLHRRVMSEDVRDYADHVPRDEVSLDKNEQLVIRRGIVTQSSGTTTIKMMVKVIPPVLVVAKMTKCSS